MGRKMKLTALVESVPAVDVPALAEIGAAGCCGVVAAADTEGVQLQVVDGYRGLRVGPPPTASFVGRTESLRK